MVSSKWVLERTQRRAPGWRWSGQRAVGVSPGSGIGFSLLTVGRGDSSPRAGGAHQEARPGVDEESGEPPRLPAAVDDQQGPVLGAVHAPDDVGDLLVG